MKLWLAVVAGMAVAGAVAGALWAWIAPPVHSVAAVSKSGKRIHEYLGNEADHFFDSAVMMFGLLVGLAIVSAVLMWQFRQRRGPAMVMALTAGGITAAGAAAGVGAGLVRLRYGHFDIGTVPADHKLHYFTEAPSVFFGHSPLQIITVLLLPAAAAALVCAAMAAGSAHDNLGVMPEVAETEDAPVAN
ncbi:MAG TPA: DUF2567 domain-containing protein [Mycobacterium sp.]|nr:DUF2567 domain-containing protein [Mycobacterium sp.]